MTKQKTYSYIAIISAMILWSVSFIWSKLAFETYNPFTVLFFRLFIAAISLVVVSKAFGLLQKIKKEDYKMLLLLSFFEPFVYFIGENFGLQLVSPSTASIMISTIPLFMPFLGYFIFKESIRRNNIIGVLISFVGVLFVVINRDFTISGDPMGFAFLMLAVFAALGYTAVVKRITYKYNAFTIVAWQNIIASIAFFPLFLYFDYQEFKNIGVMNSDFTYIVLLAIMASNGAFLLYTFAFKYFKVSQIGLFTNLIPIFTLIMAYFIFNEEFELIKTIGIALVLFGLYVAENKKNKSVE